MTPTEAHEKDPDKVVYWGDRLKFKEDVLNKCKEEFKNEPLLSDFLNSISETELFSLYRKISYNVKYWHDDDLFISNLYLYIDKNDDLYNRCNTQYLAYFYVRIYNILMDELHSNKYLQSKEAEERIYNSYLKILKKDVLSTDLLNDIPKKELFNVYTFILSSRYPLDSIEQLIGDKDSYRKFKRTYNDKYINAVLSCIGNTFWEEI